MAHADEFASSMITDPGILAVLRRLHDEERDQPWENGTDDSLDPFDWPSTGFAITAEEGDQLYLLARHSGARTVVEFATSLGFSTLYLAAALKDNGAGTVHTCEIVAEKSATASRNVQEAGLADHVDFRVGDAREELAAVAGPIDLALIDGWPSEETPSAALAVLRLIEPNLRSGAIVANDNHEQDYVDYVRDPANGYVSMVLPTGSGRKHGFEVSLRR